MTRTARLLLLGAACLAGISAGECLYRSAFFRTAIVHFVGRSESLANSDLNDLIVAANFRYSARNEMVLERDVDREFDLTRSQFGDEKAFENALASSNISVQSLRESLAQSLRDRAWIERQIAPDLRVTEEECRQFYESGREQFSQPQRFRARHLFLAAHDASPTEEVEAKRKAIWEFAGRISEGENLAQLAMQFSEDNATKARGGDLGLFSAERVPAEFLAQLQTLRIGQVTAPFQSHLGFHIVELMDQKPARAMSFEEVRPEISGALVNGKRAAAVAKIAEQFRALDFLR